MLPIGSDNFPGDLIITFLIISLPVISDCFSGLPMAGLAFLYRGRYFPPFSLGSIFKLSLGITWLFPLLAPDFWLPHQLVFFIKCYSTLWFLYQASWYLSDADPVKFILIGRGQLFIRHWFLSIPVHLPCAHGCHPFLIYRYFYWFTLSGCCFYTENEFSLFHSNVNQVYDLLYTFQSGDLLVLSMLFFKLPCRGIVIIFGSFVLVLFPLGITPLFFQYNGLCSLLA